MLLRSWCRAVAPRAPRVSWRSFAAGRDPPVEELLRDSVATEDETPLHQGPTERRKKPRSPPKPPSLTPGTDLSDKSVIMFPGQGAQFVGMGKEVLGVPSVRELYDEASQILGYDLLRLSLEGPQEVLDRTSYCQAATVVSSLAAVEFLYQESPPAVEECLAVAGFSVGEVTAAIFTGALTLTEGISLVKVRGEAMEAAAEMVPQGMVTVFVGADSKLGFGCEVAREWCRRHHGIEDPICQVANHLYCGAKVVGGHDAALEFLDNNKQDFNIRKMKRLPVQGAFHTPLMAPALEVFGEAVAQTRFSDPRIPLYSNVDGQPVTKGAKLQKNLTKQLVHAVKWETSINNIFKVGPNDLLPAVYECGPGRVLSAMLGRIHGRAARRCQFVPV